MTLPTLLVTGASGFIGRALLDTIRAERLDRSYRVVLLSSRKHADWETIPDGRGRGGLYRFTADDFIRCGISAVDYVIHLGAFTPKSASEADDVTGSVSNIWNSRHLVQNLPNAPERIVFASSIDVYAPSEVPITEARPCQPATLYGLSKLFCERMLSSLVSRPSHERTSLQIVRVGHTYGPGEQQYRKFIPETIRRLLAGNAPHFFTDGSEQRSFINVRDCSRLVLAALNSAPDVGPINIAGSAALPLKGVAGELCKIHRENGGAELEPTYEAKPVSGSNVIFDVAKMEKYLGAARIPIEDGLRDEYVGWESAS